MSDPPRLIGSANDFERSVLGAWETRQPAEGARARTLAALGVGVAIGAAGAAGGTALGGSIAPKAMLATAAILKWIGVGIGIGTTIGLVGYASYTRLALPPAPAEVSLPPPVAAPAPPAPRPPSPVSKPAPPDDGLSFESLPPAPVRSVAPKPAAASAAAGLEEEVYAIDQARRALTAGNATGALQLVDAYDAHYPSGALSQESAEIRIEALFRAGKRPLAEKLANRFLSAHPESPYAREIRALMAASP